MKPLLMLFLLNSLLLTSGCSSASPEELAERFCACSEHLQLNELPYEQQAKNSEGFRYPKELESCVGKEIRKRAEELDKEERTVFLEDFQRATLQRCPQQLKQLFN